MNSDLDWLLRLCLFHHQRTTTDKDAPLRIDRLPHFFTDLRSAWENYSDGNWLALLDGLSICREKELPIPDWLESGLRKFMIASVQGEAMGRRGKGNSPLAQARDEWKRQKRAEVFRRIRIAQSLAGKDGSETVFAIALPPETTRLFLNGKVTSVGTTREDAIGLTFLSLQGTAAQASMATLDRMMSDYSSSVSEFSLSNDLLRDLGIADDNETGREYLFGVHFMSIDDLVAGQIPTPDATGEDA